MLEILLPYLNLDAVPPEFWVKIGKAFTWIMVALLALYGALGKLEELDRRDGKRDLPNWLYTARVWLTVGLSYLVAVLEMLPVRLPVIDGWRRMRELARDPHPDDVRLDGES